MDGCVDLTISTLTIPLPYRIHSLFDNIHPPNSTTFHSLHLHQLHHLQPFEAVLIVWIDLGVEMVVL